ncbi:MAG: site-2 protease family protein [Geminocystis sp.]|nr:site-2 protease family protein [Geminocystis sp.]HIK38317.1 site-2 protease family protein [Geminocystis sp. M7585_C2015_104]MCS7148982.1 site-2 protease family protein [Geminocystis sp.]MCX8077378.1 site-2 protease family protein [Geminocystis sp.]MDW8114799.1 site-2 protease family protein [Geminocystis sp.]
MESIILFLILGAIGYVVIQKTASKITNTPLWLLWLALMLPPMIWIGWYLWNPGSKSIPPLLVIAPLILSPLVYVWLIEMGRKNPPATVMGEGNIRKEEKMDIGENNPLAGEIKPMNAEEEKALRDCFPWGVYYLQKVDYLPQAVLCLGKLMTAPDLAYNTVKANLEKVFGDRFLLLFQETIQGQPFFALVPNPYSRGRQKGKEEKLTRPFLALGLLALTLITTTIAGATIAGITVEEMEANPALILRGLPYSLCLILILGIHELGHYLLALYYKIRTTLPYFIPVPFFLGTFGAFISIKEPMPHRKAAFDVAIAGPVAGFLVVVPVLVWGLAYSQVVPRVEDSGFFNLSALDPRFSLLFACISKMVLKGKLAAGMAIKMHPMAVAGYVGLIVTALNLIPVGQLDGGHIVHGMLGQRRAIIVGQITRLLMILLAFQRREFLIWAVFLMFMPASAEPALNDVTELDDVRDFCGLLALVLLVSIILPLPPVVAQWLNM